MYATFSAHAADCGNQRGNGADIARCRPVLSTCTSAKAAVAISGGVPYMHDPSP